MMTDHVTLELSLLSSRDSLYGSRWFQMVLTLVQVEHIIREDYLVEAMEVVELYCDLLLARFGMLEQMM